MTMQRDGSSDELELALHGRRQDAAMNATGPTHALSIDVEEWFQIEALKPFVTRERWGSLPSRVELGVQRLLDLLDERGTHATFFVLGWVAERHPGLIAEIARRGHEVSCHGYEHELVTRQSPAAFREDVRRARAILQE